MRTHWFFYAPSTATATAKPPDALESALRTLAHALLRLAAKRALRHQAQARRQRVLHARAARQALRSHAHRERRALSLQLSPALARDLGLW